MHSVRSGLWDILHTKDLNGFVWRLFRFIVNRRILCVCWGWQVVGGISTVHFGSVHAAHVIEASSSLCKNSATNKHTRVRAINQKTCSMTRSDFARSNWSFKTGVLKSFGVIVNAEIWHPRTILNEGDLDTSRKKHSDYFYRLDNSKPMFEN